MPVADVNDISINYELESPLSGSGGDLLVLINGLADDLTTWAAQVPAFLKAGYRVLRYDNRGVGLSSKPPGFYTAEVMADDLHGLLIHIDQEKKGLRFHLLGVSMGGMIAQAYALKYPNASPSAQGCEMLSLGLCCTYAEPSAFGSRMFGLWADMAGRMSVSDVMRDVLLWAFTVPFFRERTKELEEVEAGMAGVEMGTEPYLSQLHVIRAFDSTGALEGLKGEGKGLGGLDGGRVLVLAAEEDILIPVVLSRELAAGVEGARFETCRGGHACIVSSCSFQSTRGTAVSFVFGRVFGRMMLTKRTVGIPGRVQQGCH